MPKTQCPICKEEFRLEIDMSIKTHGLAVFRGRLICLGKLKDVNELLDYICMVFNDTSRLHKSTLVRSLIQDCGIPELDVYHIVGKLLKEGMICEDNEHLILVE
jgi:hypothetical protein